MSDCLSLKEVPYRATIIRHKKNSYKLYLLRFNLHAAMLEYRFANVHVTTVFDVDDSLSRAGRGQLLIHLVRDPRKFSSLKSRSNLASQLPDIKAENYNSDHQYDGSSRETDERNKELAI